MNLGPYVVGPNDTAENGIYVGDARELAKAIPDESIDVVFTSPPYNVGLDYGVWLDDLPDRDYWNFAAHWLAEAYRITVPVGRLYLIVNDTLLWKYREYAELAGWRWHQLLAWCKPNIAGTGQRITKDWNCLTEWCLLFHRDRRSPMRGDVFGVNTFNWLVVSTPQSNFRGFKQKVFSAQMPIRVAYTWLARTPGHIIVDPFVGSGTTAQAAKMLGRCYLAFEINPATAQLARERVRNAQPPLFVPEPQQIVLPEPSA